MKKRLKYSLHSPANLVLNYLSALLFAFLFAPKSNKQQKFNVQERDDVGRS